MRYACGFRESRPPDSLRTTRGFDQRQNASFDRLGECRPNVDEGFEIGIKVLTRAAFV